MLTDHFEFTVSDGGAASHPATGSFAIIVNDPAALLVDLPLDEGSGTLAADVSGNGNDGTLVGGPVFEPDTPDGSGSAVHLDGLDDSIELPPLDAGGTGLTLALWFKADSFQTTDARLISKASGTAANDHLFMLGTVRSSGSIRLRARVRVGGTTTTLVAPGGVLSTGEWHHAALTHDGSMLRLFLDGVEIGSAVLDGLVDADPTLPVTIGAQPPGAGGRYFDGLVDDPKILQRPLDHVEIAALAAVGS